MELDAALTEADHDIQNCENMFGIASDGWVPNDHYEEAMARAKKMKDNILGPPITEEERVEIETHWPFDDMDEEKYM